MTAGPVNRVLLESNFQNDGEIYQDEKTEACFDVVADQIDDNWTYLANLVNTGALLLNPFFLNRQSIINGGMEIAQRGTSFTVATGTSAYTVDRVRSINNGSGVNANVTQVAVSDLDSANFGLQMVHATLPTNGGRLMQGYTLEAKDSYKLAGQQRTVSVKVKGVAGMDRADLYARYRTTEGAISDSSILIANTSATPITSTGWTTLTLTYTVPTRSTLTTTGVIGFIVVGSKSSGESSGDGFIISEWSDNLGNISTPFQPNSFEDEFQNCIRYYRRFRALNNFSFFAHGQVLSTTDGRIVIPFGTPMRVSPTFTSGGNFGVFNNAGGNVVVTSLTSSGASSSNSFPLTFNVAAGLISGNATTLIANNDITAFLSFDAEL